VPIAHSRNVKIKIEFPTFHILLEQILLLSILLILLLLKKSLFFVLLPLPYPKKKNNKVSIQKRKPLKIDIFF
jgi:hypothetical protein